MKVDSIQYLSKEGLKNIRTNRLMSLASIAVLTSCLVLIGCAVLLFLNVNNMLKNIEAQNIIMVFIEDDLTESQQETIASDIKNIDNVKTCKFVPKEESYREQLESLGSDAALLQGLEENPLPDAYKVTIKNMSAFDETVSKIKQVRNIISIRENSKLAEQLTRIRSAITYIGIGITSMLLLVSLFIIANTIRVTMFNRRLEINIMKAVGATNWFIRWPFIIEGITLGLLSSVVSILSVLGIYAVVVHSFSDLLSILGGSPVAFSQYVGYLSALFIGVGVIAGAGGSIFSMNKYLREQGSVVSE